MGRYFFGLPLLLMVSIAGAAATTAGSEPPAPSVADALAARRDVWGEQAMARPEGPTYAYFERLLPPLRYVNCTFHCYPILLSAPFGPPAKARLISNGSAINIPCGNPAAAMNWQSFPLGVTFHVDDEVFGADPDHLVGPACERGYLPIIETTYRSDSGATVAEQAFVPASGPLADRAAVVTRFTAMGRARRLSAMIVTGGPLTMRENALCDAAGHTLAWLGDGWTYDPAGRRLTTALGPGTPRLLAVFTRPGEPPRGSLDVATYGQLHDQCAAAWEQWLGRCVRLEVPEERVNRAWKALVIGTLMIASGDQMYYSGGNAYQALYEAECGDPTRALLDYGLADDAERLAGPLLQYEHQGLDGHNAAFKLQLLADIYWKTRDADFVRRHRPLWRAAADRLLNHLQPEAGLEPKEQYCGDIFTPVDSLNVNANAWRGLRDLAAVLRDIGNDGAESDAIAAGARSLRAATLAALDKSERRDVVPTFIPVALFGGEQPYETLTASRLGSYWDLMIPYVLGSGILDDRRTAAVIDYLQSHGGICMGMIRLHQHSGLYANENGVDDLYSLRYVQALLARDEPDRALVSFYGKLAQGLTRDTFIGAEGTGLLPEDARGRPMYLPPNAGGNAFFLTMLRDLLVRETLDAATGRPDGLRLLFATPRDWLADGNTIRIENAPTAFGPVSIVARSELSHGRVIVDVIPPPRAARDTKLRLRLPRGWAVTGASIGGNATPASGRDATVDLAGRNAAFRVEFDVREEVRPHS